MEGCDGMITNVKLYSKPPLFVDFISLFPIKSKLYQLNFTKSDQ